MIEIFYTHRNISSFNFLHEIFSNHYRLPSPCIERTKNGKPYLSGIKNPPCFSVTHTADLLAVAVSENLIGIDAESIEKDRNYSSVLQRFSPAEREEIKDLASFLKNWTAKESYIKMTGDTLASSLFRLTFFQNTLSLDGTTQNVTLLSGFIEDNYLFTLCSEREKEYRVTRLG